MSGCVAEHRVFKGQPPASQRSYPHPRSSSLRLALRTPHHIEAMNGGICVCVLLAALSSTCLGRPLYMSYQEEGSPTLPQLDRGMYERPRHARSAPLSGQMKPFLQPEEDVDQEVNLSQLLARLMTKKGSYRRNSSVNSRSSGLSANHRIKDRDYLGWMDFGRRSAEEDYSS